MQNIHAIDYKYKLKLYETGFCVVSKKKGYAWSVVGLR